MNASLTLKALAALALMAAPAMAQQGTAGRGFRLGGNRAAQEPKATATDATSVKKDPKLVPAGAVPEPLMDDSQQPTIDLPDEPVEPYLLTKEAGPFMVLAHTFRGPNSVKYAIALTKELRDEYKLPAYVLQLKDYPGRSMVHNVPPTAPKYIDKANLTAPEKYRTYDEAAVMVGKCRSVDESEKLLHQVKKIKPTCLNGIPTIFHWRDKSLSRALRTTNPFIPAQMLYPPKADPLIKQMNGGPHAINNCPDQYSLLVAEFSGRATTDMNNKTFLSQSSLKASPLATAADDAERMAESLAKDPGLRKTGYKPYVYHDRARSRVFMGSFKNEADPAAMQLRETLLRAAGDRNSTFNKRESDVMVAPATELTDLVKAHIKE